MHLLQPIVTSLPYAIAEIAEQHHEFGIFIYICGAFEFSLLQHIEYDYAGSMLCTRASNYPCMAHYRERSGASRTRVARHGGDGPEVGNKRSKVIGAGHACTLMADVLKMAQFRFFLRSEVLRCDL